LLGALVYLACTTRECDMMHKIGVDFFSLIFDADFWNVCKFMHDAEGQIICLTSTYGRLWSARLVY